MMTKRNGGVMKKSSFFIIMAIILFTPLAASISEINNITYQKQVADFDNYDGSVNRYNDRLYVENVYKIEEYQILDNGALQKISFHLKGERSSVNHHAICDKERLYYLERAYVDQGWDDEIRLSMVDISVSPMQYVNSINTEMYRCDNMLVYGDEIWLSDAYFHVTRKYNKYTLESTGTINNLYGTYTIADTILVDVQNTYNSAILRLYNLNEMESNNLPRSYKEVDLSINGEIPVISSIKYDDGLVCILGSGYIEMFDIIDVNNPTSKFRYFVPLEFNHSFYVDAKMIGQKVLGFINIGIVMLTDLTSYQTHEVFRDIEAGYNDGGVNFNYPSFYTNSRHGLYQYKIDDLDQLNPIHRVKKYGCGQLYHQTFNEEYALTYDNFDNQLNLYNAFTGQHYTGSKDMLYSLRSICVSDNKLYVTYTTASQGSTYLDVYHMSGNELILQFTKQMVAYTSDIQVIDNLLYCQIGQSVSVFRVKAEDLESHCTFSGHMQRNKRYLEDEYIGVLRNGFLEFRYKYAPEYVAQNYELDLANVLYSPALYLINNDYIIVCDSNLKYSIYALGENDLQLTATRNYDNSKDYFTITNDFMSYYQTSDIVSEPIHEIFYLGNGNFEKVGEFETIIASADYYYPDKNTMISYCDSGIFLYSFDYSVDKDDYTVTRPTIISSYPNPCTSAQVNFKGEKIKNISIYNVKGQLVKNISANAQYSSELSWDKKDNNNQSVPSGIYFYQAKTIKGSQTGKLMVLK